MPRLEAGDILSLLLVGAVLVAGASIIFYTLRLGISPMPTSRRVLRELLRLVPAEQQGTVLELGSGWGTLAFALADHCPRARVVAYELSPVPYALAWLRQRLAPRPNLLLVRRDFFQASLAGACLVVGYLAPTIMTRLEPKLSRELAPGSLLLTHTFALRGWKPRESRVVDDLYRTHVYLYRVP